MVPFDDHRLGDPFPAIVSTASPNQRFADLCGEQRAKPIPPNPNRFVTDLDAALMQQVLDVAQRQRISDVEQYHQADDLCAGFEVAKGARHRHLGRLV